MITYWIGGALIAGGILYFIYSLLRGFIRSRAIKHYEKIRDKLTLRELDDGSTEGLEGVSHYEKVRDDLTIRRKKEPEYSGDGLSIGNLIGGFIVIFVGTSLIGSISEQVSIAQTNVTDTAANFILGLTTLFFALAIAAITIAVAASGLRNNGII